MADQVHYGRARAAYAACRIFSKFRSAASVVQRVRTFTGSNGLHGVAFSMNVTSKPWGQKMLRMQSSSPTQVSPWTALPF